MTATTAPPGELPGFERIRSRHSLSAYKQCRYVTGFGDLAGRIQDPIRDPTSHLDTVHKRLEGQRDSTASIKTLTSLGRHLLAARDDIEVDRHRFNKGYLDSLRRRSKSFTCGVTSEPLGGSSEAEGAVSGTVCGAAPGRCDAAPGRCDAAPGRCDAAPGRYDSCDAAPRVTEDNNNNNTALVDFKCPAETKPGDIVARSCPNTPRTFTRTVNLNPGSPSGVRGRDEPVDPETDVSNSPAKTTKTMDSETGSAAKRCSMVSQSDKSPEKNSVFKALSTLTLRTFSFRRKGPRKSAASQRENECPDRDSLTNPPLTRSRSFNASSSTLCRSEVNSLYGGGSGTSTLCRSEVNSLYGGGSGTSTLCRSEVNSLYGGGSGTSRTWETSNRNHVTNAMYFSTAPLSALPPPLPDRTYLKLRRLHQGDSAVAPRSGTLGNDPRLEAQDSKRGRSVSFLLERRGVRGHRDGTSRSVQPPPRPEQHQDYYHVDTLDNRIRMHQEAAGQGFLHGEFEGLGTLSSASGHRHRDQDMNDEPCGSSGYGSLASACDTCSVDTLESDYAQLPCTLSPPLARLSGPPPLPARNKPQCRTLADPATTPEVGVRRRDKRLQGGGSAVGPGGGSSGAQLVKVISLERFMKNKWVSGVAVTRRNEYVVVDLKHAYLLDEDGNLKRTLGSKGSVRLHEPLDVTVLPGGALAFSDHLDQDVKVYSSRGQFLRRVKDPSLTNIAGVAATEACGELVVAGTDRQRVSIHAGLDDSGLLYTIPAQAGAGCGTTAAAATATAAAFSLTVGGDPAATKSPFEHPYSVAVNPLTGDIIVGDDYKQLVTAVSRDTGRVLWRFSPTGDNNRHFFPSSLCVDTSGYVFVADLYNEKVYILDSAGKYIQTLLSRATGLKGGPGAIATDGRGHLLVADEERTIKVFKYGDEKGFIVNKRMSYCPGS